VITDNSNDKTNNTNKSHNEKATQAYRLFSEGKKPFEVAIELDIRETQVNKFLREFLEAKEPKASHYKSNKY